MKITIAIIAMFASAFAWAAPVMYPDGVIRDGYPPRIGNTASADAKIFEAHGYRPATAAEIDAKAAGEAKDRADAAAALLDEEAKAKDEADAKAAKLAARTGAIRAAKDAKTDKDFRDAATVFMESFK